MTLVRSLRQRLRLPMVAVLLILMTPILAGCLKVRTTITVSDNDRVSGDITAAVKPRDDKDAGPQFDENLPFSQKISVSAYNSDGYVGSKATFSDLTFAEFPQLGGLSRDTNGVDISLRRAGNLVILEGRVDLTTVSDPDADVNFTATFPGEVTSTNGDRFDTNSVEWKLKPGTVTVLSAQSRYTDPSTRSFRNAAIWLFVAAFLVAGLIGYLAWRDRDMSPRLTTADEWAADEGQRTE